MSDASTSSPSRAWLRHWSLAAMLLAGIGYLTWTWADSKYGETPCPEGVPRYKKVEATYNETCPSVGRMNGVKLAVPQHYLLGPKGYKGIDMWNAESWAKRPKTNSFDNEWDNFAIRIRLTNFKPIETYKDRENYSSDGIPNWQLPIENRWIHVGIQAMQKSATFENTVKLWLKDDAKWGPFMQQDEEFGLRRFLSTQTARPHNHRWEFMFDATFERFFTCEYIYPLYPPHTLRESCKQSFVMPELQALIEIDHFSERADLARWPEIEREVRKVIQSFIVP